MNTTEILSNPKWPATSEGPWGGLPPELRPVFAQMEESVYTGSVALWCHLVCIGAILLNLLQSLPSDTTYVFIPEIKRCLGMANPYGPEGTSHPSGSSHNQSSLKGDPTRTHVRRRYRCPRPIILCHAFARILAIPFAATAISYYRLPKDCTASLQGYFFVLAMASANGQMLLTLRTMAIARTLRGHQYLAFFLWTCNISILALWLVFTFTANAGHHQLPNAIPVGFRAGFHCQAVQTLRWPSMCVYVIAFVQDAVMFLAAIMSTSSLSLFSMGSHGHAVSFRKRLASNPLHQDKSILKLTLACVFGHDIDLKHVIVIQFIADSARYLMFSWMIEILGIAICAHFLYVKDPPDFNRVGWIALPLQALLSLAVVPKVVVSLKRVAFFERMAKVGPHRFPLSLDKEDQNKKGPSYPMNDVVSGVSISEHRHQEVDGPSAHVRFHKPSMDDLSWQDAQGLTQAGPLTPASPQPVPGLVQVSQVPSYPSPGTNKTSTDQKETLSETPPVAELSAEPAGHNTPSVLTDDMGDSRELPEVMSRPDGFPMTTERTFPLEDA